MEENIQEKPAYFSIIPAIVRYSNELPANAKLLYGEITALCNKDGYCFASNEYFAKLYKVSKDTIGKWVSLLVNNNFLKREIVYKKGTKEIEKRVLRLINSDHTLPTKKTVPYRQNDRYPTDEIVGDNNIPIIGNNRLIPIIDDTPLSVKGNNQYIECEEIQKDDLTVEQSSKQRKPKREFTPPTLDDVKKYILEKNLSVDAKLFFDYFDVGNWIDSKGNKVKNWKQKLLTWNSRNQSKQQTQKTMFNPNALTYV